MNDYRCTPKKESRPAVILCAGLLLCAFAAFFAASTLPAGRALGQLFAALFLMGFVYLSTKYLLTEYTYLLEGKTLSLSTLQGKRIRNLGGIPVSAKCRLLTKEEWKKEKKSISLKARFSLCQNLFSNKIYVLLCPGEEGFTALFFEPDETLFRLLKERMERE